MQVPIERIRVRRRVRKDTTDIDALAASMKVHGLLHPIVLSRRYELIAGGRRLEAARRLGWKTINAVIVDVDGKAERLELELEENVQRSALSFLELEDGYARLERLRRPCLLRRIWAAFRRFFLRLFRRG
ncbi:MAG TPA: ParB N-terminal domain-containing protein [Magnetospirillaceae bacterium]|nr:ParB N-terminal domain-containing protein [Magnetospirillaceae bacterium]